MSKTPSIVELAYYLRNLLYNHDVVTLPGLGSFVTKYKPAEIDKAKKTIVPPVKYLVFDSSQSASDNLIAQHIALVKNISISRAEAEVTEAINLIIQKFNAGETILLEGIGYLSKVGGTVRFEKEQDINFLTDSYGLSNIEFEPVEMLLSQHTPFNVHKKGNKSKAWIVIVVLLLVILGFGAYVYIYYPVLVKKYIAKIHFSIKPKQETTIVQETSKDTTSKKSDLETFFDSTTDKKNALAVVPPKKDSGPINVNTNTKYYIIAGSFKTTQKAKVLAKEIEKDGFKVDIIPFDNTVYRLSLGVYSDKTKALEELQKIRETKGDDAVWLLTR